MKINIGSIYVIITCVTIILKMANIINISWLWALCPLWIPFSLIILVLLGYWLIICISLIALILKK